MKRQMEIKTELSLLKFKAINVDGKIFPVCLRNTLIPTGFEPVLTENFYIASFYRQFSTNIKIKIKIIRLIPVLLVRVFGTSEQTKQVLIL